MKKKHSLHGFTLIELVIVIVLLGILAVTAAPKLLGFSSAAKISILQDAKGKIHTLNEMIHAQAMIDGVDNLSGNSMVYTNLGEINLYNGYLETHQYPNESKTGIDILG